MVYESQLIFISDDTVSSLQGKLSRKQEETLVLLSKFSCTHNIEVMNLNIHELFGYQSLPKFNDKMPNISSVKDIDMCMQSGFLKAY